MIKQYAIFSMFIVILALMCNQAHAESNNNPWPACPDTSTQLLVIAVNVTPSKMQAAYDVIAAGKFAHLRTIALLGDAATRASMLDYLICPHLQGVFYDGDGDMNLISTADGVITADDFKKYLTARFHHHVVTIFSAADGFQNPLKDVMIKTVQAQQYIASTDPIYLGYADKTASCTMTAIIENPRRSIHAALAGCNKAFGAPDDQWHIAGLGSDYFGQ